MARNWIARKSIAALLLVVIAAWAEMAVAPMLAMHAGHMHPGYELAADVPAEHAAHVHHAKHDRALSDGRPCCPGLHKGPVAMLEVVSSAPACDDPHSCCFGQGPQSVPAQARAVQRLAREMAPALAVGTSPEHRPARPAVCHSALALRPPPDEFGMTLRV